MENKGNIFDRFDRLIRSREGVTFEQLLFLVFLYAKITDQIDWSWFLITLPLTFQYIVFYFFLVRELYLVRKMTKEKLKKQEEAKKELINALKGEK